MSEYENLRSSLAEKLDFTPEKLEILVKHKRTKIGAGYLTNQGALFLLAEDFGVSLESKIEEKVSPMHEIIVEKVSEQDLKTKFNLLKSDKRKKNIGATLYTIFFMVIIMGIAVTIPELRNIEALDIVLIGITMPILVVSTIIIIISKKFSKINLNNKETIFLEFYNTYHRIYEYGIRESKSENGKYENAINDLSDFISRWTRTNSPIAISELPDNISSNLKKKVIPQFRENNSQNIEHFKNILEKMARFCYLQEPTAELLRAFNDEISNYIIIIKEKKEKHRSNLLLKIILLVSVTGIIIFAVMNFVDPTEIHASVGYSVTIAVLVLIGLIKGIKRK